MVGLVDLVTISLFIKGNCSFQRLVFITAFKKKNVYRYHNNIVVNYFGHDYHVVKIWHRDSRGVKLDYCLPFFLLLSISMTVAEHILFYSLLKGRPIAEAEEEVENMLQDLGLPHKKDELTQNLSGLSQRSFV